MLGKNLIFYVMGAMVLALGVSSCQPDEEPDINLPDSNPAIEATFGNNIDVDNPFNYANPDIPNYIVKDNTGNNPITDRGATLGRVLFYDTNLSTDNSVSCATCHQQSAGFSDNDVQSQGVNGLTGRHSMRIINTRYAEEERFFWDERAVSLEIQSTMPIRDHGEMGFSGENGAPDFNDLITKLEGIDYYQELFTWVYGSPEVTEIKMQNALAQFIRSIYSFDSKYDMGRAVAPNDGAPFNNFTANENAGKNLFLAPPQFNQQGERVGGGAGCGGCHRPPEFDIDPNSRNNGFIGVIGSPGVADLTITRSPTLRDLVTPSGSIGPLMHTGFNNTLLSVINHYDNMLPSSDNPQLDNRLRPNGQLQQLNLTTQEKQQLIDFLNTLTGSNVYTDDKWSNPF